MMGKRVMLGAAVRCGAVLVACGFGGFAASQIPLISLPKAPKAVDTKHPAGAPITGQRMGSVNTYSFFPQVNEAIQQKGFRPKPGESKLTLSNGLPNATRAGGMDARAISQQGALFPGIQFTGLLPPDCHAATGTNHVVQVVNSRIAFYDKTTGAVQFAQDSSAFFAGIGAASFQFDPRVIYDQYNDRFLLIFLASNSASSISQVLVAASDDGDPNGTWNLFNMNSAVVVSGQNSWLDYPMVGHTGDALVVTGNMFSFAGSSFTGIQAFVIATAGLYNNTGLTAVPFTVTGQGFNLQPADTYTPGTTTVYGISLNTTTSVRVWAFTNVDTGTPALTSTTMAVQQYANIGAAPSGAANGAMDTLAGRTMDAASRDQFMVAAHTVQVGGNGRSSVRWYEINMGNWPTVGTPALAQQGNITLPTGQWAFMPAISKNADGAISVMYTRSSSSIVSDLVVSSRVPSDPSGTMSAPVLLKSGVSSNAGGRWGDYFSVTIDPDDDLTFWGHGEVTRADGLWATEMVSWVVSTPGTTTEYDATAVSPIFGTPQAGGLAQIIGSDNTYYDIASESLPGLGYFAAAQADFTISEAAADVEGIRVSVEGRVTPIASATATMYLYNWNTSQFEYVNAFTIAGTDTSNTVLLTTNLAKYVNGSGQVRVAFRAHDPLRREGARPQPFVFKVDYIHLAITAQPPAP